MAQSNHRKDVRDWFRKALSQHSAKLGQVFAKRVVIFDPEDAPDSFVNIYIADGELQTSDQGLGVLTYITADIGLHRKHGEDDELDEMELVVDQALKEYDRLNPAPFSFYKTRFAYAGDSEESYQQLYLTYQVITR